MFTNLAILGASHCNFCGFCSALSVDLTVSPPAKRHLTRREICGSAMWKICASLRDGHVSFHSECWGNTVSLYIYICVCVNMYIYIHTYILYILCIYLSGVSRPSHPGTPSNASPSVDPPNASRGDDAVVMFWATGGRRSCAVKTQSCDK